MRASDYVVDIILDPEIIPLYKKKNQFGLRGEWYTRNSVETPQGGCPRILWNGRSLMKPDGNIIHNAPSWFLRRFPKTPLDGHLVGYKKNCPDWENITYLLIDLPIDPHIFKDRLYMMKKIQKEYSFITMCKYTYYKKIEECNFREELYLIKATSRYVSGYSTTYIRLKTNFIGWATIIGFVEGKRDFYTHLGKYKCKTIEGKKFYCRKNIPVEIKKRYKFEKTRLLKNSLDFGDLGDMLIYNSRYMLDLGGKLVPIEPNYIKIIKK